MTRVLIAVVSLCALSATVRAEGDEEEPPPKDGKAAPKKAPAKKRAPVDDEDDAPTKKGGGGGSSGSVSASSGDLIPTGAPKGRVTLPGGKILFNVIAEANMAKKLTAKPVGVAPDLWLGLADKLTFGIYHSGRATTGFLTGFGTGICLHDGDTGFCDPGLGKVYTFVGSEARIGLTEGGLATAFVLGGNVRFIDPKKVVSGKVGFIARFGGRRLAMEFSPMVFPGITQRKVAGVEFNSDVAAIPLTIFLRLTPSISFAVQSGATFTLKKPGDTYRIPAAAGLAFAGKHFAIDITFGLGAVADKDDMTKATDARSASVGIGYAL